MNSLQDMKLTHVMLLTFIKMIFKLKVQLMYCTYNIEKCSIDDAKIHITEDKFKIKLTPIHTIF
jgi:hypothetical protein